jgi:protein-S-isoprenylcysteine O-methyltransferase Ste14
MMNHKWDGKIGGRDPNTFEVVMLVVLMIVCSTIGPEGALILLVVTGGMIGLGIYRVCVWLAAYRPWEHLPAFPRGDLHASRGTVLVALGIFLIPIALISTYAVCRLMLANLQVELRKRNIELRGEHDKFKGWREKDREEVGFWDDPPGD